jgi:hypothetical protein
MSSSEDKPELERLASFAAPAALDAFGRPLATIINMSVKALIITFYIVKRIASNTPVRNSLGLATIFIIKPLLVFWMKKTPAFLYVMHCHYACIDLVIVLCVWKSNQLLKQVI